MPCKKEQKIVIFIDNDPDSVREELLWLTAVGLRVYCVASLFELLNIFNKELENVVAIVSEFILPRVQSPKDIGIPESPSHDGLYAGITLLDVFLRSPESPYGNIPVVILSRAWRDDVPWYRNWLKEFGQSRNHGPIAGLPKDDGLDRFKEAFLKLGVSDALGGEDFDWLAVPQSNILIALRGKSPADIVVELSAHGVITHFDDITEFYRPRCKDPDTERVEYIPIPWEHAKKLVFVLWDGRVVRGKEGMDLLLFWVRGKPPEWGMGYTGDLSQ